MPNDAGRGSDSLTYYHGTSSQSAAIVLTIGLSIKDAAKYNHGGSGRAGFYLTPERRVAEFFAEEEYPNGAILRYDIAISAVGVLESAGARMNTITYNRGRDVASEFFIPASAFEIFNGLTRDGLIRPSVE